MGFLFKPELAQAIADLRKTQTRRPRKEGEQLVIRDDKKTILTASGRIKHQVGRDYAVPFKYGKPCRWIHEDTRDLMTYENYQTWAENDALDELAHEFGYTPMRIRLLDLWQEDVRTISHIDSLAEGFDNRFEFWETWCGFYDKTVLPDIEKARVYDHHAVRKVLNMRPNIKYQGWAYKFELLGVTT